MTNQALLLVDLQNDFCAGGALAVAEGDSTIDIANALIDWCQPRQIPVLASQTGIPRSMAASPASIRRNPIVRESWTGCRKRSGRITAFNIPTARRYIPCLTNMRLTPASIRVKTR